MSHIDTRNAAKIAEYLEDQPMKLAQVKDLCKALALDSLDIADSCGAYNARHMFCCLPEAIDPALDMVDPAGGPFVILYR